MKLQQGRARNIVIIGLLVALMLSLFFLLSLSLAPSALAAINKQIAYQGVLKTSGGVKVADGDLDILFKIYDASTGGTLLWTGTHTAANGNAVTITDGVFSVLLGSGSGNAMTVDFTNDTLYLGVKIDTDAEMTPRKRFGAAGYAFNADVLDGIDSLSFFQVGTTTATSTTSTVLSVTQNSTGDILNLFDGATEVFTVLDGGNVGVGTTSPSTLFAVSGNSYFDGNITVSDITATGTISVSGTATSTFVGDVDFDTGTLYVDSINNRIGIGTTSPTQLLHVERSTDGVVARFTDSNGNCDINPTNTALICSSDERLKDNVSTLKDSLSKVVGLRGVNYSWISDDTHTSRIGFIAQEVEEFYPELVSTNEDGYKSLNYAGFTPILVQAIKEQQAQIQAFALGGDLQGNVNGNLVIEHLIVQNATFEGDIIVRGHAAFNEDTIGQAKILAGDTSVHVAFSEEYKFQPIITLTPNSHVESNYWLTDKSTHGFAIILGQSQNVDVIFDWHSFSTDVHKIHVSDDIIEDITITVETSNVSLKMLDVADFNAPVITINGNNPAQIEVGSIYRDLGATVTDNKDDNLGIYASVNEVDVGDISNILIDTSEPSEYSIIYIATDQAGNVGTAERMVIIGNPNENQESGIPEEEQSSNEEGNQQPIWEESELPTEQATNNDATNLDDQSLSEG